MKYKITTDKVLLAHVREAKEGACPLLKPICFEALMKRNTDTMLRFMLRQVMCAMDSVSMGENPWKQ